MSNTGGNGGILTIAAGVAFTPVANTTQGPDGTAYVITGLTAGGAVNLGSTDIITTGSGSGGNVNVYAANGIAINSITAQGGSGTGGNVTLLGQYTIRVNAEIDTTSGTVGLDGAVNITGAQIVVNGSPTTLDGILAGGSFLAGTGNGNIVLGGINAGAGTVTLRAFTDLQFFNS